MDYKYFESLNADVEIKTENINLNYHMKNYEVFHGAKQERNILHAIEQQKTK
jgi:hypothetical protein